MSWPVRSRLLGRHVASATAGTAYSLGVVPAGKTWLIKDWRIFNPSGAALDINLYLKTGGVSGVIDRITGIPSDGIGQHTPVNIVAPAGYELTFIVSTTKIISLHVSGAQLG